MHNYLLFVCMYLLAFLAHAEGGTCPQGYYPIGGGSAGWSSCAPIPGYGGDASASPPALNSPVWKTRWIAIAVGKGAFGVGRDQPSKRTAEKKALADCKNRSGLSCEIRIVTYNQCAAIAGGSTTLIASGAETLEAVTMDSLESCRNTHDNTDCQVYFSGCSYPIRVR